MEKLKAVTEETLQAQGNHCCYDTAEEEKKKTAFFREKLKYFTAHITAHGQVHAGLKCAKAPVRS